MRWLKSVDFPAFVAPISPIFIYNESEINFGKYRERLEDLQGRIWMENRLLCFTFFFEEMIKRGFFVEITIFWVEDF